MSERSSIFYSLDLAGLSPAFHYDSILFMSTGNHISSVFLGWRRQLALAPFKSKEIK